MYKVYHTPAQVKLEVIPARQLSPCTMILVLFPAQQFAQPSHWYFGDSELNRSKIGILISTKVDLLID
jgi:hypothetical protein